LMVRMDIADFTKPSLHQRAEVAEADPTPSQSLITAAIPRPGKNKGNGIDLSRDIRPETARQLLEELEQLADDDVDVLLRSILLEEENQ